MQVVHTCCLRSSSVGQCWLSHCRAVSPWEVYLTFWASVCTPLKDEGNLLELLFVCFDNVYLISKFEFFL